MFIFETDSDSNEEETKRNVSKMVVFNCLVFIFGQFLSPITFLVRRYFGFSSEKSFVAMALMANTLLFGSYGMSIVIFYAYNSNYRSEFKRLLLFRN